ncbi:MAG: ABC transporter substrate-binding protein, partial [Arenicellales bacterium]
PDGRWQIYDVQFDGISLIISYRNQYGEFIANNGLDALISSLEEKAMKAGKAG